MVLVEDHALFRHGMRDLLQAEGFAVVAEASSGDKAAELAAAYQPDVVVMDLQLPGGSGAEAIREIRSLGLSPGVLVLTVSANVEDVIAALDAGADGYVLKDAEPAEIVSAVRNAAEGKGVLSPEVATMLISRVRRWGLARSRDDRQRGELSERELEVLRLVCQGKDNGEIARDLVVSRATVKGHVESILSKLGTRNRVQAAMHAMREGLI